MRDPVQTIVDNERIPTPPGVAMELLRITQSPDATAADLTKVISADPKLSAKIVSYCNSPLMGLKSKISSLQQTTVILGMRSTTMLALSFSLMDSENTQSKFDYDAFWNRSLTLAIACKAISTTTSESPDENFLLGLLLNIGQIGIGNTFAARLSAAQQSDDDSEPISQDEALQSVIEDLELDPFLVGSKLMERWHFPDHMTDFVRDFPSANEEEIKTKIFHAAQKISQLLLESELSEEDLQVAREELESAMDWQSGQFDAVYDSTVHQWKEYAQVLGFDVGSADTIAEMEQKARDVLVQTTLELAQENQAINLEREQLERDVFMDALTGIRNRRSYEKHGPVALEESRKNGEPFGIAVFDIDHFKTFNDTHGHLAGDEVLKAVAASLQQNCRGTDHVYRFGGEEFVVLLPNCRRDQIDIVANRLRTAVEELSLNFHEQQLSVTISVGVNWSDAASTQTLEEVFEKADGLLYTAKENGRNRCAFSYEVAGA
jgi:diguanylate cyclase (GGDEF)-like protein